MLSPNGRTLLQKMLIRQEGYRRHVYTDTTGHSSIGFGRNLAAKGISTDEAIVLLNDDIQDTIHALVSHIPWYVDMNEARQSALISMAFNLGIDGLLQFHEMLSALKSEQWLLAHARCLDSLGAKQAPERYTEIANIFLTGEL
jgi:lysozyme